MNGQWHAVRSASGKPAVTWLPDDTFKEASELIECTSHRDAMIAASVLNALETKPHE